MTDIPSSQGPTALRSPWSITTSPVEGHMANDQVVFSVTRSIPPHHTLVIATSTEEIRESLQRRWDALFSPDSKTNVLLGKSNTEASRRMRDARERCCKLRNCATAI